MITFTVLGRPAPKGSSRAIQRGGRAILVPSGSDANRDTRRAWDGAVRLAASQAVGPCAAPPFVDVALTVSIGFRISRPSGHWGKKGLRAKAAAYPAVKPDLDKLIRATLDAMAGIVYDDDARIVTLAVTKSYALPGNEGATVRVDREGC